MKPVVELRDITFGYGAVPVYEHVNLQMHHGMFVGLVGPSGGGKTTPLRMIRGSPAPTRGSVFVEWMDLRGKPAPSGAHVPQVETTDWNVPVTVGQVVMMVRMRRMNFVPQPSVNDRRAARKILERLDIDSMSQRHIREPSCSQQHTSASSPTWRRARSSCLSARRRSWSRWSCAVRLRAAKRAGRPVSDAQVPLKAAGELLE
jgi:ABC-type Mn2+/Zn2+ transport system ATPase subunit